VQNQPIIKVLDEIESETDLRFIFGSEIYDFQKLISLSVDKAKLNEVIKLIFENRLSYDLNENVVLLKKSPNGNL
jgi:iron complex outermembrane receptor protein